MKLYFFRIEVKGLQGSDMPEKAKGAYVNCVVPGRNKIKAGELLRSTLEKDRYELVGINKIEDFNKLEFDKDHEHYKLLGEDALRDNEVYYGEFCTWEN